MLGVYVAYWLYRLSISPIVSISIAVVAGRASGYILYKALFRKILESKVHSPNSSPP